ncbi:MAG: DoxX family membrane protein [Acidimicrobiia bacterium]|nr:DoxX family membrane protein [Acidimicrobiia bacterium]
MGHVLQQGALLGHVKWFSDFDFGDAPRVLGDLFTPTLIGLVAASTVVICTLVLIDSRLNGLGWYGAVNEWLSAHQEHSDVILRAAMAAVLLVSWENRALLTPELQEGTAWVGWLQFVLAIALLIPRTSRWAGAGIGLLWLVGVFEYGAFHMLDYLHYVGISVYLFLSGHPKDALRGVALPALYSTVGFALIWLGFEKLVYPEWALHVLEENPSLLLGMDAEFFLQGAAFVEISLGFLLIIGLLERPLAAVITLVFFTTTLIFGRIEVVGHTPLHAALVVFLLRGPGTLYRPPIELHGRRRLKVAFAAVNFVLVLSLIGVAYTASAQSQFDDHTSQNSRPALPED